MVLTSIVGNYDAILVPLLLNKDLVLSFLPSHLRDSFCAVGATGSVLEGIEVPDDKHPVLFVLGRQDKCGPYVLPVKLSFQEAKLEIPFVRHAASGPEVPHSYKNTIIFDSHMMSMSSQYIAGLHSRYAHFTPPRYSSSAIGKDGGDVVYAIDNVLELKLSQENAGVEDRFSSGVGGAAGWLLNELAVKELLELPWFGEGTGKIASRFVFDWATASQLPEPIKVDLTFRADWFYAAPPGGEPRVGSGWTAVKGVTAFQFCAQFTTA